MTKNSSRCFTRRTKVPTSWSSGQPGRGVSGRLAAVGFGANLGEREETLDRALLALAALDGVEVLASSRLVDSPPWGDEDQPPFVNAAALVHLAIPTRCFLAEIQRIEHDLGKRPVRHWGPRHIDIDILVVEGETAAGPDLVLPHPHIRERPFVVGPLRDILGGDCPAEWARFAQLDAEGIACPPSPPRPPSGLWGRVFPVDLPATTTVDEDATRTFAAVVGRTLRRGDCVALSGDMGAGKTRFAQGVAVGLGFTGVVNSPTFTLCQVYDTPRGELHHWDFYRMESADDLESAGFDDALRDAFATVVEWPGRIESGLPDGRIDVRIDVLDGGRSIAVDAPRSHLALRAAVADWSDATPCGESEP